VAPAAIVTYAFQEAQSMGISASSNKNRRVSIRRTPKGKPRITCVKGSLGLGRNIGEAVLDLSETGIRFIVSIPLEKRQEIEVTLQGQAQPQAVKLMAEVVWCVATADKRYCVGARFQKYLSYADFGRLT
jgi:PilZ domain-containing protein